MPDVPGLSAVWRPAGLPDGLARTALSIVENPEKVVGFSPEDLSRLCRVGGAGIVRLCRMAGWRPFCDGADAAKQRWDQGAPFWNGLD